MSNVAVIMSVYKNDKLDYFVEAVFSMINQTHNHVSLFICVDGMVSDDIENCLHDLMFVPNIHIFRLNYNHGLAFALNLLIDEVISKNEFDYVARMDSDDISFPDRIRFQVEFLEANPEVFVCGTSCREFGADYALNEKRLPQSHGDLLNFSITHCPFIHPTVMFRISIFENGIRYPTTAGLTEDMALWFHLLVKGYRFANIPDVLLSYRLNDSTLRRRRGLSKAFDEVKIRLKYMRLLKKTSFKNIFYIVSRFLFHFMNPKLMGYCYKYLRLFFYKNKIC